MVTGRDLLLLFPTWMCIKSLRKGVCVHHLKDICMHPLNITIYLYHKYGILNICLFFIPQQVGQQPILTDHVMCRQPLGMTYDLNATFVNFTLTSTEGNASDARLYGPNTWAASKIGDHTYVQVSVGPKWSSLIRGNLIIKIITQKGTLAPLFHETHKFCCANDLKTKVQIKQ